MESKAKKINEHDKKKILPHPSVIKRGRVEQESAVENWLLQQENRLKDPGLPFFVLMKKMSPSFAL